MKIITRDTFDVIQKAVNNLGDFVRPTFGPSENRIIVSNSQQTMAVDDGAAIARDYDSGDALERAVLSIIKETAQKTNDKVGDGTTASLIILQAIMQEIWNRGPLFQSRRIELELRKGASEAIEQLRKQSKSISSVQDLKRVSRISYNNDSVSSLIGDLVHKVGKDGIIAVEEHSGNQLLSEIVDGTQIDSGWSSPYFVTNPERMECVLDSPYILITDYRLVSGKDIEHVLNKIASSGNRSLLIISEHIEGDALATLIVNKIKAGFKTCAINAPTGSRMKEFLSDVAILTGGEVISADISSDWDKVSLAHLGRSDKVIARKDRTVILGSKGKKNDIKNSIGHLRNLIKDEKIPYNKELLERRLAKFTNGIASIKVGATTESERRALKYKIEDAVNAVRSAYRGGVVCGAGLSLDRLETSSPILNAALKAPLKQLRENTGIQEVVADNQAFDAVTGKVGDFMELGIIDPTEVLIAGIECAVSIACILCSVKGILYETNETKTN